ncbi:MAG TPA: PLP-dependent cysteine synthase family protein, partial [Motiliproteus sp.]
GDATLRHGVSSRIEGIGRPQVEASFQPDVIHRMIKVPDAASVAAIYWLEQLTGRKAGASTGTNLWGVLQIAAQMMDAGQTGSIVTLMCDSGERYLDSYYDSTWVAEQIGDILPYLKQLQRWL